ncbi:MAG: hypothetical protein KDC67_00560 [Ignavibacteriae bacterium]|nr:hypothetical protein [Ignavibacteriota bacterium]
MKSKEQINSNIKKEILRLNSKLELLISISKKYSLIRLFVFISILIFFFGFYVYNYKTSATIIASVLGMIFLILMHNHSKVEKSIKRFKVYIKIKKEELARLELDWENIPILDNSITNNPTYLEQDLYITEKYGLLQLINTSVSLSSVNILRDWLNGKIIDEKIFLNRQKIISELKILKRFRDRLLLTTKLSIKKSFLKVEISNWINNTENKKGLKIYTIFLTLLCFVNIFMVIGYSVGFISSYYYQFLLVYIFFYIAGTKLIKNIQDVTEILYDEVRKFSSIFKFIENYNYTSHQSLKELLQPFLKAESAPSKSLSKINITIEILNMRKNPFLWFFFMSVAPIDYLLSIRVEKFRESIKTDFPQWLNTWYNLEAYCSLAEFAYLNPDYNFAEINETQKLIEAKNIGHPLINPTQKVANDLLINETTKTNLITGSNMSGKSTFLRTIGVNVLLAYSGSVVNAEKFVISKFNLYTCIKVSDSVVDGLSYFYSEVKRLKNIIDEIKNKNEKSLVLIDEIYKGTNNVERIIGSKALIKYLSNENIYSIITTHDLELIKIADEIRNVKNYHFKELIEENKMSFDFKLMEGPCPTTNALKIMKLEGLPT